MDLPPEARSVSLARRRLRDLLDDAPATGYADAALLALSEVVTNAVVHTGAQVHVEVWAAEHALRIEVADGNPHLPTQRHYAVTAGTGRGLHLLESTVDRWGASATDPGKVVWFEFGEPSWPAAEAEEPRPPAAPDDASVTVTLLNVPLLMHWAWQEHAQALLREYLLFALDTDPGVIDVHAAAGDALTLLHEQLPVPRLPDDPGALLAGSLEPGVTAQRLELLVPRSAVAHFATLDEALGRAGTAAQDGSFLGPPTQPEISEFRSWLCAEVVRQAAAPGDPRPWAPRTGVHEPLADEGVLRERYRELLDDDASLLAVDEASIIVAVSAPVVEFLGYRSESDLLGRRVIVVVPHRYHQAHIAGTTLNATNGRDVLLDVPVTVPVVRADGSEVMVEMRVVPQRLDHHHRVFVAHFSL